MNTAALKTSILGDQDTSHPPQEGPVAKAIEERTSRVPSDTFLWLALGSIGVSATLQLAGRKQASTFVGQWAPTLLILGLYNKLVKVAGSDQVSNQSKDFGDRQTPSKGMKTEGFAASTI